MTTYDRDVLADVIVHHGRTEITGCHCGWSELGRSHAEHVAKVYEERMAVAGREEVATLLLPAPVRQMDRLVDYLEGGYGKGVEMRQVGLWLVFDRPSP